MRDPMTRISGVERAMVGTETQLDEDYDTVSKSLVDAIRGRLMDMSEQLIFHYCSAETLPMILQNKTLRFSDAGCMNDGEELIWAQRQFEVALQRLRDRDDIPEDVPAVSRKFIERFEEEWIKVFRRSRHFLASFSLSGDSLSQWRAYADDAQGFSVGFRVDNLDIPARFVRVEYDVKTQQHEIVNLLADLYKKYRDNENYFSEQGVQDIWFIFEMASAYKNPAFIDEREVRGGHPVALTTGPSGRRQFKFMGGKVGTTVVEEAKIDYRVSKRRLVPYIDFPFQLGEDCPLNEVWLGPKCSTPEEDVELFLATLGYGDVIIKRAGSKYR